MPKKKGKIVSEREFEFMPGDEIRVTCRDKSHITRVVGEVRIIDDGDTWVQFSRSRYALLRKKGGQEWRLAKQGFDCGKVQVKKLKAGKKN